MDLNKNLSYMYTPESVGVPYATVQDILKGNAKSCPDREAVVFRSISEPRKSLKYAELYEKATNFAKGLIERGVVEGDVVAISNKNTPEWMVSTLGVQMTGAAPLHFFFKKRDGTDVSETLRNIPRCTALIIDAGKDNVNIDICKNFIDFSGGTVTSNAIVDLRNVILLNESRCDECCSSVQNLIEIGLQSCKDLPYVTPDDVGGIFLTSGSTGVAKAIPYTHLSLLRLMHELVNAMKLSPGTIHYNDRPFSWQVGYPTTVLFCQATLVTSCDTLAQKTVNDIQNIMIDALETENCTSAVMITSCIHTMLHSKAIPNCKQWPLNVIATGGLPVESTNAKCAGTITKTFVVLYGSTEVGLISSIAITNSVDYEDYAVGYPIHGMELKVVDDEEKTVSRGTMGELYARSRDRFPGYINNEQKTKECINRAGWYKTDDIAVMRENGCIVVTGRKSDMMILGGVLVSPIFLESIVKKHPGVADVYIYPVYDNKNFQCAHAAVVTKTGESLSETELKDFVVKHLGGNKDSYIDMRQIPKHFVFFDAFPRTHNGKLDRKATSLLVKSTGNHLTN